MSNQSTRLLGSGVLTLTASTSSALFGSLNRNQERAQFVVSNLSTVANNYTLYITDSSGNEVCPIFASQSVTFESDGEFRVKNSNAASVDYIVGQMILRNGALFSGRSPGGSGGAGGAGVGGGSAAGGSTSGRTDGSTGFFGGRFVQP